MRSPITWLVVLFVVCGSSPLRAQPEGSAAGTAAGAAEPAPTEPMTIATRHAPPFAIKSDDGQWSGIAIELWNRISERTGYDFRYTELGLKEMLDAVIAGRIDAAAAALTITSDREQVMDFSHPFHTSGLAVAVPLRSTSLFRVVKRFLSPAFLVVVAALLALLVAVGVLIWLAERRANTQFQRTPVSGIGSGLWWSAVTMTTVGYGDKAPTTLWGRVIALVWMFAGLIAISSFTAAITTTLTVNELDASVSGVDDLRLKRVLTLGGSTSDQFLTDEGIRHRTADTLTEALEQLAGGAADAVVHDAPILRYQVKEAFSHRLQVLPLILRRQDYGIALPHGSPAREPVNVALLDVIRSEEWFTILDQYLGAEY